LQQNGAITEQFAPMKSQKAPSKCQNGALSELFAACECQIGALSELFAPLMELFVEMAELFGALVEQIAVMKRRVLPRRCGGRMPPKARWKRAIPNTLEACAPHSGCRLIALAQDMS
jgi:hypothetical protein